MSVPKKLLPAQIAQIVALHKAGMKQVDLAAKFGCAQKTISTILKAAKVQAETEKATAKVTGPVHKIIEVRESPEIVNLRAIVANTELDNGLRLEAATRLQSLEAQALEAQNAAIRDSDDPFAGCTMEFKPEWRHETRKPVDPTVGRLPGVAYMSDIPAKPQAPELPESRLTPVTVDFAGSVEGIPLNAPAPRPRMPWED